MLQYGGVESFLERLGACIEIVNLLLGERIKLRFITTGQVREDGLNTNGFVGFQMCNKPRHVLLIETQTMHAAVYLDMKTPNLGGLYENVVAQELVALAAAMTVFSD